jgi:4-diphosphocytidyl-2-C-methyl-D-erythritol kinase
MILYPPAKINLGLHILAKRPDGYHEIETIMAAIPFCDILELTPSTTDTFISSGIAVPTDGQPNLCQRAVALLRRQKDFPNVHIHLRKQIPIGAGLGGGSADASYTLLGLNQLFNLNFSIQELASYAAELGSDCPFFIRGGLQLAKGRGELLHPLQPMGREFQLVLCNPQIHVSTAQAYSGVKPTNARKSIEELFSKENLSLLHNDFEDSIFLSQPLIANLKKELLAAGACYAAMSGSGSSVFGLFDKNQKLSLSPIINKHVVYMGNLSF